MNEAAAKTITPRRRARFRYSVRSILVLTAIIACPLGYIMYERHRCQQQQRADSLWRSEPFFYSDVGEIRLDYGKIEREESVPIRTGWMATILGDNSGDQCLSLTRFSHSNRPITRGQMYALSHLFNLKTLAMPNAQIEQTGYHYLGALRRLETLDLQKTNISDQDLESLRRLTELSLLKLNNTQIGNQAASHLSILSNLKTLHLQQTQIGDAGVQHLSILKNLEHLDLSDTRVSEKSINLLAQFTKLKLLALNPDNFSFDARDKLRKRLPTCDIIFAKY